MYLYYGFFVNEINKYYWVILTTIMADFIKTLEEKKPKIMRFNFENRHI